MALKLKLFSISIVSYVFMSILCAVTFATPQDVERCVNNTGDPNSSHIVNVLVGEGNSQEQVTVCSSTLGEGRGNWFDWVFLRSKAASPDSVIKKYVQHHQEVIIRQTETHITSVRIATADPKEFSTLADHLTFVATASKAEIEADMSSAGSDERKSPETSCLFTMSYIDDQNSMRVQTVDPSTINDVMTQQCSIM